MMNQAEEKIISDCWERFKFIFYSDYRMGLFSMLDEKGRYCHSSAVKITCVMDFYTFCKTAQFPNWKIIGNVEVVKFLLKNMSELDKRAGAEEKKRTEAYLNDTCN